MTLGLTKDRRRRKKENIKAEIGVMLPPAKECQKLPAATRV